MWKEGKERVQSLGSFQPEQLGHGGPFTEIWKTRKDLVWRREINSSVSDGVICKGLCSLFYQFFSPIRPSQPWGCPSSLCLTFLLSSLRFLWDLGAMSHYWSSTFAETFSLLAFLLLRCSYLVWWAEWYPHPKFLCWSSNPQGLRMWQDLETGPLKR